MVQVQLVLPHTPSRALQQQGDVLAKVSFIFPIIKKQPLWTQGSCLGRILVPQCDGLRERPRRRLQQVNNSGLNFFGRLLLSTLILNKSRLLNILTNTRSARNVGVNNRDDNDIIILRWGREGAEGWNYESCLPYFRKAQTHQLGEDEYRCQSLKTRIP